MIEKGELGLISEKERQMMFDELCFDMAYAGKRYEDDVFNSVKELISKAPDYNSVDCSLCGVADATTKVRTPDGELFWFVRVCKNCSYTWDERTLITDGGCLIDKKNRAGKLGRKAREKRI